MRLKDYKGRNGISKTKNNNVIKMLNQKRSVKDQV